MRLSPRWLLFICVSLLLPCAGCSLMATAVYIWNPNDVDAQYTGLQSKNTVVICRADSMGYSDPTAGRELATLVGRLLEQNDKKIKVVSDQRLSDWTDRNDWKDFKEVGRAMKADMVVAIELEGFGTRKGSTLLQGNTAYHVKVLDMSKNGEVVWDTRVNRFEYPKHGPIPTTEGSEADFRRRFMFIVAENIAHNFYEYDSRKWAALDSTAMH